MSNCVNMSDSCIECKREVRQRQHAITCDVCDQWQHRLCGNTGISREDYLKARKRIIIINFTCRLCKDVQNDEVSTNEMDTTELNLDTSAAVLDTSSVNQMHSTLEQSPGIHGVTFNLDYSFQSSTVSQQDVSVPVAPEDSIFDVTRDGPTDTTIIQDQSIQGPCLTNTILEDEHEVTFEVIEEGTTRRKHKLVSSDGFSYIKKRDGKENVQWRCSVRRKDLICYASVTQRGQNFTSGITPHCHPSDPIVGKRVKIKRDLIREGARNVHASAGTLVDENMTQTFQRGDFNLPRPSTLVRTVNRARQKLRPNDPTTLDFEVDTEYLNDDFLIGDVHVGQERHLLFATKDQLSYLQQAKRWYLDATFKVVDKPFYQLFSVHAFLKNGDSMKQVPLAFVLMSKRRKQDYVAVFQKILDMLDEAPAVEGFVMDFEAGLWQAICTVFPETNRKGCIFHWAQAVLRHVGEVGLKRTYEERQGAHQLIRKLLALPFLPGPHIRRAFERLRQKADTSSQPMRDLFEYAEDQWIESSLWSESEWSVYRQTIRTNNDVEGWHRRLNAKAGKPNLKLYVLLPLLLREAKLVNLQYQLVSDAALGRHRRARYSRMDGESVTYGTSTI